MREPRAYTANVVARGTDLDPYVRSRLLHHQNPASLQRYEHLVPDELHEAREKAVEGLRKYLGEPVAPSPMPTIYVDEAGGTTASLQNDRGAS